MFIDRDFLTIEDLKSIGISDDELGALYDEVKGISLNDDGVYVLVNSSGLNFYTKILYNNGDFERYKRALERCFEIDENYSAAKLLFSEEIKVGNFEKAFSYFDVFEKFSSEYSRKDCNLWLLLLSYVTEIPEKYMDLVNNFKIEDILICDSDIRYVDKSNLNKIRTLIYYGELDEATQLLELSNEASNGTKVFHVITRNLLYLARDNYHVDSDKDEIYYDLIANGEYLRLVEILENVNSERRFTFSEFCLYNLAKDMIMMIESGRIPKAKDCNEINFIEAIVKHNYELALQINRCSAVKENCSKYEDVSLLLQRLIEKKDEIKLMRTSRKIGSVEFAKFYNDLMNNDIDSALENLNVYLAKMGKSEYYNYVFSLIKLSLLDKDRAYVEPMLALSSMSRDDFDFDVSPYLQDFYFSFTAKDYKRAIVYLNIISSSKDVGGPTVIDTIELAKTLFGAIKEANINELDLVIDIPKKKVAEEPKETVICHEDKVVVADIIPSESKCGNLEEKPNNVEKKNSEELLSKYSQLAGIIDKVSNGDNLVLLEPMNDEDTQNIMYLASCVPDIEVSLVDSIGHDSKHVMLRYNKGSTENISGGDLIRAGNSAYYERRFEDCIDCFEQFISGRGIPRSFIYAKLGLAYRALGTNDGYRNAIDCLTVATHRSKNYYEGDFDFTRIVNELKGICGYNGIKVIDDDMTEVTTVKNAVQYKKTGEK